MHKTGLAWALIVLVGAVGLVVALQGWRARGPDVDVIASMVRAVALVDRGHLPRRGNLTDHNAFRPPGTSWLLVPGVVLFDDPRLVEATATSLLYVLTLPGIVLIGRHVFGDRAALYATLLYGGSSVAIYLGGFLQPKAYPFFSVWLMYFTLKWAGQRDSRYLAAAVLAWSCGCYVHIEMAPFILIPLIAWVVARPPVRLVPILVAVTLALAMWSPYLAFERDRGFIDLQSQLFLQRLDVRGPILDAYCGEVPQPAGFEPLPLADMATWAERPSAMADLLLMDFENRILLGPFVLFALMVAGAAVAIARPRSVAAPSNRWTRLVIPATGVLLFSEFALRWVVAPGGLAETWLFQIRRLFVFGTIIGVARWVVTLEGAAWSARLRSRWIRPGAASIVALGAVVPTSIIVALTEPGVPRLLAVWPFSVLLIAGFTVAWVDTEARRRWHRAAVLTAVALITATNLEILDRVRDWRAHGWSGVEPAAIQWAEFRPVRCEDEP